RDGAPRGRAGLADELVAVGRVLGRRARARPLRRLGAGHDGAREARLHRREHRAAGASPAVRTTRREQPMPSDSSQPLQSLSDLGQSVWIDNLSRESIRGGHLQELIDDFSVVGATSNPSIFQKAMSQGDAYDEQLGELVAGGADVERCFWELAEQDIREACDVFAPVFESSGHRDGYVSLEVDPRLAYDTLETYREAMRLHREVDRPNLMVKIPATKPGL